VYLKSLKLKGFKSFADRSRLEFRPGVTVIVGPNGTGKSNLVDALSWVLGTQSAKTLRTPKMEDVIFAGTATRPSLSKAEVTLIVDNADRRLDIDLDEVAITRRIRRDGAVDYELNGVGCRLLDIQDLLADSGVGRRQHVIIGQGEIGEVLSASPEDHRAVIEEAAGILKHRRRKERSERRLERTDDDLARLQDLIGEIGRQMRPLRRQARAAERYDGLKAEVKALRLHLGGAALAGYDRDLTIAVSEKSMRHESLEVDERRLEGLAHRIETVGETAGRVGADLDRDTSAAAMLETTNERLRRMASVAHERRRARRGRREAAVERRVDLIEEREAVGAEIEGVSGERAEAASAAEAAEKRFRRLEDEERAVAVQSSLSPEGAVAAVRGELSALEPASARDRRERENVARRLDVLAGRKRAETAEVERINEEIRELDAQVSRRQAEYEEAAARRQADQESWSAAESALAEARLERAASASRVEAVRAAAEGRFDDAAREVVESAAGAIGSLTSQLSVPEGLEAAVGAALGPWVDAVAFDDMASLRDAVEAVKASGGGSAPVVSAVVEISSPAREVAAALGVEALIDRLGPDAHAGLAGRLLGDVLLVEGWMTGWDLIARHPALRAVTPEGDLIWVSGAHIARPDGAGPAMLETATVALERAETALARAESIHTAAARGFESSRDAERAALERLEAAEAGLAGRSEAMGRFQKSVAAVSEEQARLEERNSALGESIDAADRQASSLRRRLAALEGEEAERMRVWEELEARRLRLAADRESARSDWQEAAETLRAVSERDRLLRERSERIDDELGRLDSGEGSGADPEALTLAHDFARRAVSVLEDRIAELRDRQARLREESGEAVGELERARAERDARRASVSTAAKRVAELDVRLTELRLRREAVIEAIRRDADADEEEAMGAPRPDLPEGADLDELLDSKLAQLARLGPINPLAADELGELEERHTFLSDQMADVESSRAELRKVISALEAEIEQRFQAAFTEVAEAFERYFEILFPGGRGRIRLMDTDDPRSGVAIEGQPLGKKVRQMSLLSGGERSLAALAFLFAVFEARPSPFYVLDEVEAALDDPNLRRFLRIVDEFRGRAQLLIVTHQQQTMEAADVLYGVTMAPGGSSQVVRKDMAAAAAPQQVA